MNLRKNMRSIEQGIYKLSIRYTNSSDKQRFDVRGRIFGLVKCYTIAIKRKKSKNFFLLMVLFLTCSIRMMIKRWKSLCTRQGKQLIIQNVGTVAVCCASIIIYTRRYNLIKSGGGIYGNVRLES